MAEPLTLEEWTEAVEARDGIRISDTEMHSAKNPQTGTSMGIKASPGDAEIFDADSGQWHFAVMWTKGRASFNARIVQKAIDGDVSDPFWLMFLSLAAKLGAQIYGEEGEIYDSNNIIAK